VLYLSKEAEMLSAELVGLSDFLEAASWFVYLTDPRADDSATDMSNGA